MQEIPYGAHGSEFSLVLGLLDRRDRQSEDLRLQSQLLLQHQQQQQLPHESLSNANGEIGPDERYEVKHIYFMHLFAFSY
jgi:hypothetical protein